MPSKLFNSEGRHSRVRALSGNESEEKKRVHPSYFSLNAGGTAGISRPGMSKDVPGLFLFKRPDGTSNKKKKARNRDGIFNRKKRKRSSGA